MAGTVTAQERSVTVTGGVTAASTAASRPARPVTAGAVAASSASHGRNGVPPPPPTATRGPKWRAGTGTGPVPQ
jgi:hypothetical protein